MNSKWRAFWKGSCLLAAVLGFGLPAFPASAGEPQVLSTKADKASYSTGFNIVRNLKKQGGEFNLDLVIQGMKDALNGENLLMTEYDLLRTIAGLEMTRKQDRAANRSDDIKTEAAGKGIQDDAEVPQKPDRPEQGDQNGPLAAREPVGWSITTTGNAVSGYNANAQQGLSAMNRPNEQAAPALSPNGTVLSRRNQAKLTINELKAEMRAKVLSGDMPKSE